MKVITIGFSLLGVFLSFASISEAGERWCETANSTANIVSFKIGSEATVDEPVKFKFEIPGKQFERFTMDDTNFAAQGLFGKDNLSGFGLTKGNKNIRIAVEKIPGKQVNHRVEGLCGPSNERAFAYKMKVSGNFGKLKADGPVEGTLVCYERSAGRISMECLLGKLGKRGQEGSAKTDSSDDSAGAN